MKCKGTQLAYIQSDEISLLVINYQKFDTQSWFDNNLQKMVSVAAAVASSVFTALSPTIFGEMRPATFDARAFVVPKEEVCNYFLERQRDATRNSVQMLARTMYSQAECNNKIGAELQELIFKKGVNWNDCPVFQKRGRCVVKESFTRDGAERFRWVVDNEIAVFSQDKNYIDKLIMVGEK